jgi:hypothetical protein
MNRDDDLKALRTVREELAQAAHYLNESSGYEAAVIDNDQGVALQLVTGSIRSRLTFSVGDGDVVIADGGTGISAVPASELTTEEVQARVRTFVAAHRDE